MRHPLRAAFVMEQVLGHVTHYRTLRAVVDQEPGIEACWVEVTYSGQGRLESMRALPWRVRSTARGFLQVRNGLGGPPVDAVLFHTQKPAVFQWDQLKRFPSVLSLDVTPKQYDRLGQFYDHAPDGDTPLAQVKHWMNRRTFALASCIVVWSNWVKRSLIDDYGVPEKKVRVIPPGVDLKLWDGERRAGYGLPRVLFVGGDFERKGGQLLLNWFRECGRGRCELDIVTRAELAPEQDVRVHRGIVRNSAEARRLFFGADVFVLPSLGECFGIASVEAMAARLPVIATDVGGAADIVDHGTTGFLVPPDDPPALRQGLDRLLGDPALRMRMGANGRAKAERAFDGGANARALLNCLHAVSNN